MPLHFLKYKKQYFNPKRKLLANTSIKSVLQSFPIIKSKK